MANLSRINYTNVVNSIRMTSTQNIEQRENTKNMEREKTSFLKE